MRDILFPLPGPWYSESVGVLLGLLLLTRLKEDPVG